MTLDDLEGLLRTIVAKRLVVGGSAMVPLDMAMTTFFIGSDCYGNYVVQPQFLMQSFNLLMWSSTHRRISCTHGDR